MTIRSMPSTDAYRDNFDRIFRKEQPAECDCLNRRHINGICQRCGRDNCAMLRAKILNDTGVGGS